MSGKGKYTQYVAKKSPRRSYMEKIFKASPFAGLEDETAPAFFAELGNKYLSPTITQGNPQFWPQGVNLEFDHPNRPNLPDVKWKKAGDPAGPYYPDNTAPGPGPDGQVNLQPNDVDPEITIQDVKPNYVPGVLGTPSEGGGGTVNPAETTPKIARNATLGKDFVPGSSQKG